MSDDTTQDPQEETKTETLPEPEMASQTEESTPATEPVKETVEEVVTETESVEEITPAKAEPAYKAKLANFQELKPGQTIRVHERIIDISPKGEKRQRVQVFEGIIIGLRGAGLSRTLTVRKISGGIGVEKIYPINSPVIAKIELVKTARVRRAKLTFLTNFKQTFKRKFKEVHEKK